jgi:hypothetical protein
VLPFRCEEGVGEVREILLPIDVRDSQLLRIHKERKREKERKESDTELDVIAGSDGCVGVVLVRLCDSEDALYATGGTTAYWECWRGWRKPTSASSPASRT